MGNQASRIASSSTSSSASQKFGTAKPTSETTSTIRPAMPPRRALTMPSQVPTRPESTTVPRMIDRLGPIRSRNASATLCPLNRSVPRLPCTRSFSQCPYCTSSGWSMPSACRIASYCSGVYVLLWLLRIARAASPGASETSTNVSAVTTNSSAIEESSQRRADRIIEGHLLPDTGGAALVSGGRVVDTGRRRDSQPAGVISVNDSSGSFAEVRTLSTVLRA